MKKFSLFVLFLMGSLLLFGCLPQSPGGEGLEVEYPKEARPVMPATDSHLSDVPVEQRQNVYDVQTTVSPTGVLTVQGYLPDTCHKADYDFQLLEKEEKYRLTIFSYLPPEMRDQVCMMELTPFNLTIGALAFPHYLIETVGSLPIE